MSNPDVMKFRWQIHGQTFNFTRVARVSGNHRSADIPVRFGRVGAGPAGALSLGCQGVALGLLLFLANGWIGSSLAATHPSDAIIYTGMADASGAVAVGTNWFAVANDEDNPIRIYRRDQGGPPVKTFNFTAFLELDPKKSEVDFEAATRVGDRAYWLSSNGRNRKGRERSNRHRFYATTILETAHGVDLTPVGKPYKWLLEDLCSAPQLKRFNLAQAAALPPKDAGALNIEGLCGTPDQRLLIGFRNPVPGGLALVVPMMNPDGAIAGKRAVLGEPILLDLGGLGIRDMAYGEGKYLIVAGPYDGHKDGGFALYEWSGGVEQPKKLKVKLRGFSPEAIIIYPDKGLKEFQLLSDDGTRKIQGRINKELPLPEQQFRGYWVAP